MEGAKTAAANESDDEDDDEELPPAPKASFSPSQIAMELTCMDWEYFRAISPLEFVGQAWNKASKDVVAPNVVAWTQWFNKVRKWVGWRGRRCCWYTT